MLSLKALTQYITRYQKNFCSSSIKQLFFYMLLGVCFDSGLLCYQIFSHNQKTQLLVALDQSSAVIIFTSSLFRSTEIDQICISKKFHVVKTCMIVILPFKVLHTVNNDNFPPCEVLFFLQKLACDSLKAVFADINTTLC